MHGNMTEGRVMRRIGRIAASAFVGLTLLAAPAARAGGVPAGTMNLTGTATMDITLLPGPFNPTGSPIVLPGVSGYGTITLTYDAEDTTTRTIHVNSLSGGMYYGSYPGLGSYVFGNVPPLTGSDFTSEITDVVQNPDGSFKSGIFTLGGPSFDFKFLSGPAAGLILMTDSSVPFSFAATFNGLPPTIDTTLMSTGNDVLPVFIDGDPTRTPVATSENRSIAIAAVPEPSSVVMLGLGALGLLGVARRSRRGA